MVFLSADWLAVILGDTTTAVTIYAAALSLIFPAAVSSMSLGGHFMPSVLSGHLFLFQ